MEMTQEVFNALTDNQRLEIINSLAQKVSSTPLEMQFDTLNVILLGIATGLNNGDLKQAAKAITDVIYFKSDIALDALSSEISDPSDTPAIADQVDGIFPLTGLTFVTDAVITHADGSKE